MRRSCEGDDKTSKEVRLQVKIIKKKKKSKNVIYKMQIFTVSLNTAGY